VDKDLKSMTLPRLERLVIELGEKKYTAGYIFGFIHKRGVTDISAITPLSKSFRSRLTEKGCYISTLKVIEKLTDPDGTIKYVFGLPDDKQVESVLLFEEDRRTLCISTQVGCAMACAFCATGRLGLSRNLTTGEIVDQVNIVTRDSSLVTRATGAGSRVTNVVFMGMGEPLANYDAVIDAVRILNHPEGRKIGIRRITVSSCGIPEGIERLAKEDISPRLAISLNAPTDAIRLKLMPIAKKYPLDRVLQAVANYQQKTHNRVTFEYVLIKGANDTVLHAQMLVKRLRPFLCNANLIEYNPHPGCEFKPADRDAIERFAGVLKESGLETTIRFEKGQSICAACGQLGAQEI
jgi:23S rRNA (adenine2503-C2)-methyltransferase